MLQISEILTARHVRIARDGWLKCIHPKGVGEFDKATRSKKLADEMKLVGSPRPLIFMALDWELKDALHHPLFCHHSHRARALK